MKLDETKLQEVVEKIAYQQFGAEQIDDLCAKMGILNDYVQEQLRLYGVVSSCVDKDELISDLDDRRAVGVEMNEDMWYFCRKQSAEYLLDKYKLLRK